MGNNIYFNIRRFWPLFALISVIFIMMKYDSNNGTWIDKMLVEMEQAWIEADSKSGGQIQRDQAVAGIAEEYFAYGMSRDTINKLLADFKERGFQIGERRREGYVKWPEGNLIPYSQESRNSLGLLLPDGMSEITIRNDDYGRERLIIKKGVAISLILNDTNNIVQIQARIWTNTI